MNLDIMVKYFIDKGLMSRSSVLEIDGDGTLANAVLKQVPIARIMSWELVTSLEMKDVSIDVRFSYNGNGYLFRNEYDVLICTHHNLSKLEKYLNPFLCRFMFLLDLPEGKESQVVIARLKQLGYTSLRHDNNILYAQYLYHTTKYPRTCSSVRFPYHYEGTPQEIAAWVSPNEIQAIQAEAKEKIYMEIGTFDGFSAFMMCQVARKVICIDPYDTAPGRLGQVMKNTVRPNIHKLVNITGFSHDVNWIFPDAFLDILLIDGDHHYQAVKRDYFLFRRLVKVGGIIAFHDYGIFPTVGLAVDEVVKDDHYKSIETLILFRKNILELT